MSSGSPPTPLRGEIWQVSFDPTLGAEIRKTRPAIVVSSDSVGRLPIKLVAPITDWKVRYEPNVWHVRIDPDLGEISPEKMEEVILAIGAVIEYS